MSNIFLLVPEPALRDALIEQISAARMTLAGVIENVQALAKQDFRDDSPVVILDAPLFDKKLETTFRDLIDKGVAPTLLVLGEHEESDVVTETFAKPFRLGHLISRLRYYIETAPLLRENLIEFGPYRLEPQNRRVLQNKSTDPIRLTEKETALLVYLAQSAKPATRQDILAAVWGYDERIDTHTLETHIYQLRRKLDSEGDNWLVNEAGAYRLARVRA